VARLAPGTGWVWWATHSRIASVTVTPEETSVIAEEHLVPDGVPAERGFVVFVVHGPLPFELTGVLAAIVSPLAAAGVSCFAFSTFDTDYLLVPSHATEAAVHAWRTSGLDVVPPE
jgi:hypothetical protein